MLGGTLTATFLALSDARPDFATMGAVGAAPADPAVVAASYALASAWSVPCSGHSVGFGAGHRGDLPAHEHLWLAPGSTDASGGAIPDHFLDVPWPLVLGLVVGLPLLLAAIVAVATRSRLPMVSRLS